MLSLFVTSPSLFQSLLLWIQLKKREPCRFLPRRTSVSILVIVDIAQKEVHGFTPENITAKFQSLLLWIQLKKFQFLIFLVEFFFVSILVIVDIAQKVCELQSYICHYILFQSLLLWIQLKKRFFYKGEWQLTDVSILVIVDIAQKVKELPQPPQLVTSFNPCYCGYSSKSWSTRGEQAGLYKFQSLLLWIQLKKTTF